ncbi:hypothetical protein LTR12_013961 [Friedmanniomyces endolithicus]|nr:hypothetical protein LTR12_013961 [Friedmanniomyces endolithicus]
MKEEWEPKWIVEGRKPTFVSNEALITFGGRKYFWGNVPAIDVVQLDRNEGAQYQGDLRLLFAASGDMRNVLETVRCLPQTYGKTVSVHINDKDFDIVARNLIITLAAFVAPDDAQAVDCMLHIWYSAMITRAHADFLRAKLRPLISDVVFKIERKAPDAVLGKTWIFSAGTCRAELTKSQWDLLLSYFEVPAALTTEKSSADSDRCHTRPRASGSSRPPSLCSEACTSSLPLEIP